MQTPSIVKPEGFDLILFGGTGDLTWRKLIPALFQAFRHGTLPAGGRILGVGREDLSHEQYRERISARFREVDNAKQPRDDEFAAFAQQLFYLRMDLSKPDDYQSLAQTLAERNTETVVMYVATAPSLFTVVVEQLAAAGLNTPKTRVVLEKPLGHDLDSNRAINRAVRQAFTESQIFRIDHYLGKPSVQNHALQLLCAIAMEPPINAHADAIRDEKLKVLRSLRRWTPETLNQHVVRGQYAAGMSFGKAVNGYLQEPGVPPLSHTETYVALRTEIDNWRWAGVPFYIRTGKRLAGREARIVVNFRPTPHAIFKAPQRANNQLVINLQPNDGLELHLLAEGQAQRQARTPGSSQTLAPVQLDLDFDSRFGSGRVGAYERLLLDVIDGRLNLFVRSDEQEAAWRWVQPILENWQTDSNPIRSYPAGTWGPPAASAMIARDGHCWNEER